MSKSSIKSGQQIQNQQIQGSNQNINTSNNNQQGNSQLSANGNNQSPQLNQSQQNQYQHPKTLDPWANAALGNHSDHNSNNSNQHLSSQSQIDKDLQHVNQTPLPNNVQPLISQQGDLYLINSKPEKVESNNSQNQLTGDLSNHNASQNPQKQSQNQMQNSNQSHITQQNIGSNSQINKQESQKNQQSIQQNSQNSSMNNIQRQLQNNGVGSQNNTPSLQDKKPQYNLNANSQNNANNNIPSQNLAPNSNKSLSQNLEKAQKISNPNTNVPQQPLTSQNQSQNHNNPLTGRQSSQPGSQLLEADLHDIDQVNKDQDIKPFLQNSPSKQGIDNQQSEYKPEFKIPNEQFDQIEFTLQQMEDTVLRALKWLEVDEKNIADSTADVTSELVTSNDFFEQKRLAKRKEIEAKYDEKEKLRLQKVQDLELQRRLKSAARTQPTIQNQEVISQKSPKVQYNQYDNDEELKKSNLLMSNLDEINKDLIEGDPENSLKNWTDKSVELSPTGNRKTPIQTDQDQHLTSSTARLQQNQKDGRNSANNNITQNSQNDLPTTQSQKGSIQNQQSSIPQQNNSPNLEINQSNSKQPNSQTGLLLKDSQNSKSPTPIPQNLQDKIQNSQQSSSQSNLNSQKGPFASQANHNEPKIGSSPQQNQNISPIPSQENPHQIQSNQVQNSSHIDSNHTKLGSQQSLKGGINKSLNNLGQTNQTQNSSDPSQNHNNSQVKNQSSTQNNFKQPSSNNIGQGVTNKSPEIQAGLDLNQNGGSTGLLQLAQTSNQNISPLPVSTLPVQSQNNAQNSPNINNMTGDPSIQNHSNLKGQKASNPGSTTDINAKSQLLLQLPQILGQPSRYDQNSFHPQRFQIV